jgi:hypothetical protein
LWAGVYAKDCPPAIQTGCSFGARAPCLIKIFINILNVVLYLGPDHLGKRRARKLLLLLKDKQLPFSLCSGQRVLTIRNSEQFFQKPLLRHAKSQTKKLSVLTPVYLI